MRLEYYNSGMPTTPSRLPPTAITTLDPSFATPQDERYVESEPSGASGRQSVHRAISTQFERLAKEWKKDTLLTSAIEDMAVNRHYQQIIGMGRPVVPLILAEMKREPNFWFWALRSITGEDPVPKGDLGNLKKMTDAWLRWGRKRGFSV